MKTSSDGWRIRFVPPKLRILAVLNQRSPIDLPRRDVSDRNRNYCRPSGSESTRVRSAKTDRHFSTGSKVRVCRGVLRISVEFTFSADRLPVETARRASEPFRLVSAAARLHMPVAVPERSGSHSSVLHRSATPEDSTARTVCTSACIPASTVTSDVATTAGVRCTFLNNCNRLLEPSR
jgi:hypothetical protein